MTTKTTTTNFGFGSQSDRFTQAGMHPLLLTSGRMPYDSTIRAHTTTSVGPGSYELTKYGCFSEEKLKRTAEAGSTWERAALNEKWAQMPHLLYQDAFKNKIEQKKRLGPGYYNPKHSFEVADFKTRCQRGMLDSSSERFSDIINNNPGPGAYGVPDEKLEEKRKNKPGKVQLFERSKESRDLPRVGCEVPPGTYNHKSSIDELINKRVSTRGPYDVFSESRSTIKWGHYAENRDHNLGPGQYNLDSFIDQSKHETKKGKFGKISQYPNLSGDRLSINNNGLRPRNPNWPGPGFYSPQELTKSTPVNQPPFLFSANRSDKRSQAFFNQNFNQVGVGRYDIERIDDFEKSRKLGLTSMFDSKSSRMPSATLERALRERLVPRNLDHQQKLNLHLTGNVNVNNSILAST